MEIQVEKLPKPRKKGIQVIMNKDKACLKHIMDVIQDVENFTAGTTEKEFLENKKTQYAVQMPLEMIGEATKNLSSDLKMKNKQVKWKKYSEMQNSLRHRYFEVDLEHV
jgi:uncharacterized protein with HEPN domain